MRIALISDIHSNLEALTEVLKDIEKNNIDTIHCLGDVIGYGPEPAACLEEINKSCDIKLMGNHEYAALGLSTTEQYNDAAKEAWEWTQNRLSDYELSIIADFEMERVIDSKYRLVHASPFEPDKWHYIITPANALQGLCNFKEDFCFIGHSHLPQIYIEQEDAEPRCQVGHNFLPDESNRYIINIGSVGQPRDNDPRAGYVIIDTNNEELEIIFNRVEYDIKSAQDKMIEANLPEILISRLSVGR